MVVASLSEVRVGANESVGDPWVHPGEQCVHHEPDEDEGFNNFEPGGAGQSFPDERVHY